MKQQVVQQYSNKRHCGWIVERIACDNTNWIPFTLAGFLSVWIINYY